MRTTDTTLPRRPTRTEPALPYGSLSVPKSATGAFDTAVKYLQGDAIERGLIDKLERSPTNFRLNIIHDGNDSYDPMRHQINWDPYSALRTTCGGHQSAALGLGHEIDHATFDPRKAAQLVSTYDPNFDNLEEKRVITGSERHAAHTLGEDARHDHRGSVYAVSSPVER